MTGTWTSTDPHGAAARKLASVNIAQVCRGRSGGVKEGKDVYVGISKDVNKRAAQHGDRFDSLSRVTPTQYTRNEARAMEQQIKNMNPGYQNKINSISPMRQQYETAINWAKNEINRIQKEINKLERR